MSARVLWAVGTIALIAGCAKSSEDAQVLSPEFAASRGYDAYNDGNLPRAEAYFEIALEADPDNPYARIGLDEVRASLEDRSRARAATVVQASHKAIADTPARAASVAPEPVERPFAAPSAVIPPAVAPPVETRVVEAVVRPVDNSPAYVGTIDVETAPVMIMTDEPFVSLSPGSVGKAGQEEDGYQTVGSYDTYLATLETATEPRYIASVPPVTETGMASAFAQTANAGAARQASLDTAPTVETVAVIPDPAPIDFTAVATAYPVQDVLQYGQPLNFADEGGADAVVQTVAAPASDGGQGVTIAASGPAGGEVIPGTMLDGVARPAMPGGDAGARAIRPETWALRVSPTNGPVVLK